MKDAAWVHDPSGGTARLDIYKGTIACQVERKVRVPGRDGRTVAEAYEKQWRWVRLGAGIAAVSLQCQPNRHLWIGQERHILSGAWQSLKQAPRTIVFLKQNYCRPLGFISERRVSEEVLSRVRFGRVASLRETMNLQHPLMWACHGVDDDLEGPIGPEYDAGDRNGDPGEPAMWAAGGRALGVHRAGGGHARP